MPLDYDLFRTVVAPEYASMTDDQLDAFADEAECEVAPSKWGCRYNRAVALITAHLISVAPGNASQRVSGQLKKTKVGDLEREFAIDGGKGANDSYNMTIYGKEFIRIRKQILRGPIFVGC